jgi:adenylate kinase
MILLVGAPGSGKSVQAELIQNEANVKWLSMGELLRNNTTEDQRERMEQGDLLDDAEVEDILANAINQVSNGTRILIDGFPRRDSQVHWFRGFTKAARRDLEAIIHIKVPVEEVVSRLVQRGRLDDKEEIVRKRYKLYEDEILPMLKHMENRGTRIIEIDGMRSVDEIHKELMQKLKGTI